MHYSIAKATEACTALLRGCLASPTILEELGVSQTLGSRLTRLGAY
jgi:hypothetical protein